MQTELPLADKQISVAGRLASMTQADFCAAVEEYGGKFVPRVSGSTSILVVGQHGLPLEKNGKPNRHLERAEAINKAGGSIRILSEDDFLKDAGFHDAHSRLNRLHSLLDLTRLLDVSRDQILRWMDVGLLVPVETVNRLHFFEFQQVARLKTLDELHAGGASRAKLLDGMRRISRWCDEDDDPATCLTNLGTARRLIFRLPDGRVMESSGQLVFDFDAAPDDDEEDDDAIVISSLSMVTRLSTERRIEMAVRYEIAGQFSAAEDIYDSLLQADDRVPEVVFNFGNLRYAEERFAEAADMYDRALELDPEYIEALSNLGAALAELGELGEAIAAYERLLEINPNFADAHFNLADLLEQTGRTSDARRHWAIYLRHDTRSEWASHARRRLEESGLRAWRG